MAVCGCTGACNCTISEDGYFADHPELGRNFTQVDGAGTTEDPYVIHFIDQEQFRPRTAEITIPNTVIGSGFYVDPEVGNPGSAAYQSPITFLIREPLSPANVLHLIEGNYFMVGCSATFAETADSQNNFRSIILTGVRGIAGTAERMIIGGQTCPGGGVDPITLSCASFASGLFTIVPGLSAIIGQIDMYLLQTSGSPMNVTDIKIWMTQI